MGNSHLHRMGSTKLLCLLSKDAAGIGHCALNLSSTMARNYNFIGVGDAVCRS
jgi:hypothetical protein